MRNLPPSPPPPLPSISAGVFLPNIVRRIVGALYEISWLCLQIHAHMKIVDDVLRREEVHQTDDHRERCVEGKVPPNVVQ